MYKLFKQKSHFNAEIHILLFSKNFQIYSFTQKKVVFFFLG